MHRLIARAVGKLSETLRSGRSFGAGGEVLQFDVRMCTWLVGGRGGPAVGVARGPWCADARPCRMRTAVSSVVCAVTGLVGSEY